MNRCNTLQAQERNMSQQGKIAKCDGARCLGFIADAVSKDIANG